LFSHLSPSPILSSGAVTSVSLGACKASTCIFASAGEEASQPRGGNLWAAERGRGEHACVRTRPDLLELPAIGADEAPLPPPHLCAQRHHAAAVERPVPAPPPPPTRATATYVPLAGKLVAAGPREDALAHAAVHFVSAHVGGSIPVLAPAEPVRLARERGVMVGVRRGQKTPAKRAMETGTGTGKGTFVCWNSPV
jgi:hypothetical protein